MSSRLDAQQVLPQETDELLQRRAPVAGPDNTGRLRLSIVTTFARWLIALMMLCRDSRRPSVT